MVVHAACGGSTNLVLHLPAIAHAAGLRRPTVNDWIDVNRREPRLVDVLPNGPVGHPTVRLFLAGGVPEVMLHLRRLGLLDEQCLTVAGEPLGRTLDWWEASDRRRAMRARPHEHRDVSARQPGAGRLRDQEHRHRSFRGGSRRRLPEGRPRAGLHA